jgi:hypothetical protein
MHRLLLAGSRSELERLKLHRPETGDKTVIRPTFD